MLIESIIIIIVFSMLFIISIVISSIALNKINQNQVLKDIGITNEQLKNIESEVEDYVLQKIQPKLDDLDQKINTIVRFDTNNSATQLCIGNTCITSGHLDVLRGTSTFRLRSTDCNGVLNKTGCKGTGKVSFVDDTDTSPASYFNLDYTR